MPQSILVKKFGGTSVGSIERIEAVAERLLADFKSKQEFPVVVASAMSGETNRLVGLGHQINPLDRGPAYDMLVASGEQVSIALLAMALQKRGAKAKAFLAYQLGIETDDIFSKARIKHIRADRLKAEIDRGVIPIVAGFQGVDADQNITTLGRGGSDTSAVALAASLNLPCCEIYTDVAKVCSADPRIVSKARELDKISFEEMMEMASLGSKVLHIRSVEIAAKYGVRLHVRSSFENRDGTWILPEGETMENALVSSVTHDASTVVVELEPVPAGSEFLAQLFTQLAARGVSIDIITQSRTPEGQRLAFSITEEDLPLTKSLLAENFQDKKINVRWLEKMAKVSIVGVGMRNHPGVAAGFFKTLARLGISTHLVTTSEIKISAVIDQARFKEAAAALHTEFHLDRDL